MNVLPAAAAHSPQRFLLFVLAELMLAMAIPFVAIEGYHTLLGSRAGTFVVEPTATDPGWKAFVDPTPVAVVVEVLEETPTGLTIVVPSSHTIVLVPGALVVDGKRLEEREPAEAASALGAALRLHLAPQILLSRSGWEEALGKHHIEIDNPDPVVDEAGRVLLDVGAVALSADVIPPLLGRPAAASTDTRSTMPRRRAFWSALSAEPLSTILAESELGAVLSELAASGGQAQVLELPLVGGAALNRDEAERLIREIVAFPTGTVGGERLRVDLIDRVGTADLSAIAAAVAARGIEVRSIGNASVFDGGPTELLTPSGLAPALLEEANDLSASLGAATVLVSEQEAPEEPAVVQLLLGNDFDLTTLS